MKRTELWSTQITLTSGKGSDWLSDEDEGGRPSRESALNGEA